MFILTIKGFGTTTIPCATEAEANERLAEHLNRSGRYLNPKGPGMIFELIKNPKPGQRGRRVARYTILPA